MIHLQPNYYTINCWKGTKWTAGVRIVFCFCFFAVHVCFKNVQLTHLTPGVNLLKVKWKVINKILYVYSKLNSKAFTAS